VNPLELLWISGPVVVCNVLGEWFHELDAHASPAIRTPPHWWITSKVETRPLGFFVIAGFLKPVVPRRQVCIRRLGEHPRTTRHDPAIDERRLEPTRSTFLQSFSVSVLHQRRRYRRLGERSQQTRCAAEPMHRPHPPSISTRRGTLT